MDKPKFSIVVPVYNAEGYLRKCLDSLLRQGLDSYEILLVNDGSTDSSLSICQEYAENNHRIKVPSVLPRVCPMDAIFATISSIEDEL